MSVTLAIPGGTTLTLTRNPRRAEAAQTLHGEAVPTAAGRLIGLDYVVAEHPLSLSWPSLTAAQLAGLRAFAFEAGLGAFSYTDPTGSAFSARFAPGSSIVASEIGPDAHAVDLTLLIEA